MLTEDWDMSGSGGCEVATKRVAWFQWVALAIIIAIASFLRWHQMGKMDFFMDELWHVELAMGRGEVHDELEFNRLYTDLPDPTSMQNRGSVLAIWNQVAHLTHPPLYLMGLRLWCDLFGAGDVSARGFSAFCSIIGIFVAFDLVRRMNGTTAALWTAAIMAATGPQLQLSQEVRQYTFAMFFCLVAADGMVIVLQKGIRFAPLIAVCVGCVAAMLSHYFTLPVLLALGIFALMQRGKPRTALLGSFAVAAILFAALWLPHMLRQQSTVRQSADPYLIDPNPVSALMLFYRVCEMPVRAMLFVDEKFRPLTRLGGALLILPFFFWRTRPQLRLWTIWLAVNAVFFAGIDASRNTMLLIYPRYLVFAGPALFALCAAMFQQPRWLRHALPATVALCCLMSYPEIFDFEKPEYRSVTREIDRNWRGNDAVVVVNSTHLRFYSRFTFLAVARYSKFYPLPIAMVESAPDESLRRELDRFDSVWVLSSTRIKEPGEFLPGWKIIGASYHSKAAMLFHLVRSDAPNATTQAGK
jgi:hypothetical protein